MLDKKYSQDQFLQALNREVHNWESIFNSLHDPAMIVSPESLIVKANQSMLNFLGKPMDEVIGKTCYKVVHGTDAPVYLCPHEMVKKTKKHQDVELYIAEKDMFVIVSVDPCLDEKGDISCTFHAIRDITGQRKVEKEIDEISLFKSLIIDNAAEGICVCHEISVFPFSRFTVWNSRMKEITGYTCEEINQLGWYQSVYPDPKLQEAAKERMARMRQGDNLALEEWEITRKDGAKRILLISTSILKSEDDVAHVLAIMNDISERKKAEEKQKVTSGRLQYLLSSISVAIYTARTYGDFGAIAITENVREMTGYEPSEFIQNSSFWIDHVHPDDAQLALYEVQKIFKKDAHTYEYRFLCKNGKYIWIQDEMKLTRNKEGDAVEIIGYWLDISERKKAEEQIVDLAKFPTENPNPVFRITKEKIVLYANPAAKKIFSDENIKVGQKLDQRWISMINEALSSHKKSFSKEMICKDRFFLWSIYFISGNEYINVYGIDVTELTKTARELLESEGKYRGVIETSIDAIMVFDAQTRQFIEVNKACEDLYGYSREQFLKLKQDNITAELDKSQNLIDKILAGELREIVFSYHKKKDGTIFPVEISMSTFELNDCKVICSVARDISERRKIEVDLKKKLKDR
ncbi:MAG: PAS domain S-box protein [Candidatus Omnitrophota bacterium]